MAIGLTAVKITTFVFFVFVTGKFVTATEKRYVLPVEYVGERTTETDLYFASGEKLEAPSSQKTFLSTTTQTFNPTEAPAYSFNGTKSPVPVRKYSPRNGRMKGLNGGSFFRGLRHTTIEEDDERGVIICLLYVFFYAMLSIGITLALMLIIVCISYTCDRISAIQPPPRRTTLFPFKLEPTFADKARMFWKKCIARYTNAPSPANGVNTV